MYQNNPTDVIGACTKRTHGMGAVHSVRTAVVVPCIVVEGLRAAGVPDDTIHLACLYRRTAEGAGMRSDVALSATCAHVAHKVLYDAPAPLTSAVDVMHEAMVLGVLDFRLTHRTRYDRAMEHLAVTSQRHLSGIVAERLLRTQYDEGDDEEEAAWVALHQAFATVTTPTKVDDEGASTPPRKMRKRC